MNCECHQQNCICSTLKFYLASVIWVKTYFAVLTFATVPPRRKHASCVTGLSYIKLSGWRSTIAKKCRMQQTANIQQDIALQTKAWWMFNQPRDCVNRKSQAQDHHDASRTTGETDGKTRWRQIRCEVVTAFRANDLVNISVNPGKYLPHRNWLHYGPASE